MDDYNNSNNQGMPNSQPDYREQYNNTYGTNQNNNNYNQPDYSQQYNAQPQQYPVYNGEQYQKKDGKAIASFVLSLVSLFCCGLFASIPGLILGIVSRKNRPMNNGLATAGIIISAISIGIWLVSMIVLFATGSYVNYSYYF